MLLIQNLVRIHKNISSEDLAGDFGSKFQRVLIVVSAMAFIYVKPFFFFFQLWSFHKIWTRTLLSVVTNRKCWGLHIQFWKDIFFLYLIMNAMAWYRIHLILNPSIIGIYHIWSKFTIHIKSFHLLHLSPFIRLCRLHGYKWLTC